MSSTEIEIQDRYTKMDKIVKLHVEGRSEHWIAKSLGMKRAEVVEFLSEYREFAQNNSVIQERAKEMVHDYDRQINRTISEFWDLFGETDDAKLKNAILKNIADVDAKRLEGLQKAGVFSGMDMGDLMAEQEVQIENVKILLRDVIEKFPETRAFIISGLNRIMGETEPVETHAV